jgi:two-component system NtrC family response regulator
VFHIHLPPLRERRDDIGHIAEFLIGELNRKHSCKVSDVSQEVMEGFLRHTWPGNVRELRNVIERAVLVSPNAEIRAADLALGQGMPVAPARGPADVRVSLEEIERRHIDAVLQHVNWHQGRAAEILGIAAKTLYRKMRDYGLRKPKHALPRERA